MKFNCTQSTINNCISLASRAVPSRPSHPVLGNLLISAGESIVTISGFDLALGIQVEFPAVIDRPGTATLPAKLFGDIISRLPDEELEIEIGDDWGCTIASSSGKYQVRGMSPEDYPELPSIDGDFLEVSTNVLLDALRGTLFAASSDESKQVMTGVNLSFTNDTISIGSTDGHRLAVTGFLLDEKQVEYAIHYLDQAGISIPSKALRELTTTLGGSKTETISFACDRTQASFQWQGAKLITRLLDGQYPNYRQLIPKQFSKRLTIDRKLFLGALERVAIIADQKNNIVKFSLTESELIVGAEAQDVGSASEALPIQYSGEEMSIAFNVKYLMDGLRAMVSSEIVMEFNAPTSPAIVVPLGEQKMTYLCMPVQIRSEG